MGYHAQRIAPCDALPLGYKTGQVSHLEEPNARSVSEVLRLVARLELQAVLDLIPTPDVIGRWVNPLTSLLDRLDPLLGNAERVHRLAVPKVRLHPSVVGRPSGAEHASEGAAACRSVRLEPQRSGGK